MEEEKIIANETSLNRLLNKHTDSGYAIVSACRNDWNTVDELKNRQMNNKMTDSLKKDIYDSGFQYIPVQGGFHEKNSDEETVEDSFIIVNYKRGNDEPEPNVNELKEIAIDLCGKYNQDSVLVVEPGKNPTYYKHDGSVDFELSKHFTVRDNAQEFFTRLGGNREFTFLSESRQPATINGLHSRRLKGEICEMFKIGETSRLQKAKKAFLGQMKNIKVFAIITPENPMAREVTKEENKELCRKFEKELLEGKFVFHKVRGKFGGNLEHSYMVFNVPLDTVKYWASEDKFNQQSFFMCESKYDKENRRTGVVFNYWDRVHGSKNLFEMVESSEQWINANSNEDGFTAIGKNFKFSIPLDIFSETVSMVESMYDMVETKVGSGKFETMLIESINNKGFNGWANRAKILHLMENSLSPTIVIMRS